MLQNSVLYWYKLSWGESFAGRKFRVFCVFSHFRETKSLRNLLALNSRKFISRKMQKKKWDSWQLNNGFWILFLLGFWSIWVVVVTRKDLKTCLQSDISVSFWKRERLFDAKLVFIGHLRKLLFYARNFLPAKVCTNKIDKKLKIFIFIFWPFLFSF